MSYAEIGRLLFISGESVRQHIEDYAESGKLTCNNGGSSSLLSAEQTTELRLHLETHLYMQACEICAYVKEQYGIFYSVSGMTDWLHRNGFSFHKPHGVPAKADSEKQQLFINQYNKLANLLAPSDHMVFLDSVHPTHKVRFRSIVLSIIFCFLPLFAFAQNHDYIIDEQANRVGFIYANTKYGDRSIVDNVSKIPYLYYTQGNACMVGSTLFKGTEKEINIVWADRHKELDCQCDITDSQCNKMYYNYKPDPDSKPLFIIIDNKQTIWKTSKNITIGTTLNQLEKIYGFPINLAGFADEEGTSIIDKKIGNKIFFGISYNKNYENSTQASKISALLSGSWGMKPISSSKLNEGMRDILNIKISQIRYYFGGY